MESGLRVHALQMKARKVTAPNTSSWTQSPQRVQKRALPELCRFIFLNRPILLEEFEAVDATKDGRIDRKLWGEVMGRVLGTGVSFPWDELCDHICCADAEGRVAYVQFLCRFHNPLTRMLADAWAQVLLADLDAQLGASAAEEFVRLDKDRTGKLSFHELRELIYRPLNVSRREDAQQAVHVFAVFRVMDTSRSGFVTKEEFISALAAARERAARGEGPLVSRRRESIEAQWDTAHALVHTICKSHVDLPTLFRIASASGGAPVSSLTDGGSPRGCVTQEQFLRLLTDLLSPSFEEAEDVPSGGLCCCFKTPVERKRREGEAVARELCLLLQAHHSNSTDSGKGKLFQKGAPPTLGVDDFEQFLAVIDADANPGAVEPSS